MKQAKFIHKAAWHLATAFFLLIAWATSREDYSRNNLPLLVRQINQGIFVSNESNVMLDSLTLVLNGVYSLEKVDIMPNMTIRFPLDAFLDLNGTTFPQTEQPHKLEVYYNGTDEQYSGGYYEHKFE